MAMGSYNGAETCELVGLYILNVLVKIFGDGNVGLYRDDGLAIIPIQSGYKTEKLKKSVHKLMKGIGLKVTVEAPLRRTDFLDVKLDLDKMSFSPFHKPNSRIQYVNAQSNHPKSVLLEIPKSVNDRLTKRSSSKKEFDENKGVYERALLEAGFNAKLEYERIDGRNKRRRKRKITWFNPPYCASVKTNIARKFINLVEKHFTKQNPLHKIFNKNNIRVSYCCMRNIGSIIKAHNAKVLGENNTHADKPCNCKKRECPFKTKGISCRAKSVVYKAEVKTKQSSKFYIGLCEGEFKERYNNHISSFNSARKAKPTILASHVRELKQKNEEFEIDWSVVGRSAPIKDGDAVCRLCLKEATTIAYAGTSCINQRSEIANNCMHKRKFLLKFSCAPD